MKIAAMTARCVLVLGFAVAIVTAFGCSGGYEAPGVATLLCSDGGPAGTNAVTLNCAGETDATAETERVDVVIGGPSSGTTTLRGLNFDVTYDPAKVEFLPAASYVSPLFPSALIVVTMADGQQGRLIVSIQQTAGSDPVSVAPGPHVVLSVTFRSVAGVAFGATPLLFDHSEATAASAGIGFDNGLALAYQ